MNDFSNLICPVISFDDAFLFLISADVLGVCVLTLSCLINVTISVLVNVAGFVV